MKKIKTNKGSKGSVVISLGDEGAIITAFKGSILEKRAFIESPFSSDFQQFINTYPNHSIYLLLDNIDQNYVFTNIPALRSSNVNKIIKRKINNEFDPKDINAYYSLGKDPTSVRKDLKYVLLSIRNASPVSDWLEVLEELPNNFMGIYLLPIESENLLVNLRKIYKKQYNEEPKQWEIFISHNKVGGYRQVVFKDGKIIFTRISQSPGIQTPDSVGLGISQEALNTLEYIRRIGYTDNSLTIYTICSKEASQFVEIHGVEKSNILVVSPHEVAVELGLQGSSELTDKFSDVVFASNFINSKKNLPLFTPKSKKIKDFQAIKNITKIFLTALVYLFPLLTVYFLYSAFVSSSEIGDVEDQIASISTKMEKIKDFEKEYDLKPEFIDSVVVLNDRVTRVNKVMYEIIGKYYKTNEYFNRIIDYKFKQEDSKQKDIKFSFEVNSELTFDEGKDLSDILYIFDQYRNAITEEFKGYNVSFKNFPSENNVKINSKQDGVMKSKQVLIIISGTYVEEDKK